MHSSMRLSLRFGGLSVNRRHMVPLRISPTHEQTNSCIRNGLRSCTTLSKLYEQMSILSEKNKTSEKYLCTVRQIGTQHVRDNVKGYVVNRYFEHVKQFEQDSEKKFPHAMKLYRSFFDGFKKFFADMKRYLQLTRIVHAKGIVSLNRQELELYMQMPKDMLKMMPTLVLSSLPVVGYAVFPLVFMFPRIFLTCHFWNPADKIKFEQLQLQKRLSYMHSVYCCLKSKLNSLMKHHKYKEFNQILHILDNGQLPTVNLILESMDIFAEETCSLVSLSRKHIKLLVKMHQASRSLFKRHSLFEHAYLVHYMDKAICREGGVHNMPSHALRTACYIRGLNPENLSEEEIIAWMQSWIKISTQIDKQHLTLLLHLPLLLGYNHPNNRNTIHTNKFV